MFKKLLIGALLVAAAATEYETDNGVLLLNDETFDAALKEFDPLLVAFVAPWCGHCKRLKPEFGKAAQALAPEGIRIAQVDATQNKDLSDRFDVSGFPTIKFFRGGAPNEYTGGRDAEAIASWLRKRAGPAATKVSTVAEADAFEAKGEVAVVAFVTEGSSVEKTIFEVAGKFDDVPFAVVHDDAAAEIRTKYGVPATGSVVVVVNDFEGQDNLVTYSGSLEGEDGADALVKFVTGNSLPHVITFSQEAAPKIFRGEIRTHFLLFADASEGATGKALTAFRTAAKENVGKALFVNVPPSEDRVISFFGVTAADMPAAVLVSMGADGGSMKKFKFDSAKIEDASALSAFLEDYTTGKLKPFLKSAEAPPAEEEAVAPVKTVVGTTFESIVLDDSKDVLLEIYAPWCGHCKSLAPAYEKLGQSVAAAGLSGKVTIAKMDGTLNEIDYEGINVKGFPTIVFLAAGKKATVIDYDGSRDLEGFMAFIKKNAANDVSALVEADDEDDE